MNCSKMVRSFIALLSMAFFASCATTQTVDQGAAYFEQGLYDQAAAEWSPLADEGDAIAQHNLGGLSRYGWGSTPLNLTDSTYWFYESAK